MIKKYFSLVKFSHTIFALPFAICGFVLGLRDGGGFDWKILGLIILCMVFARSAAMGFNRLVDRKIDSENNRTNSREIPAGVISPTAALWFVTLNCVAFILCSFFINSLCFYLSPVALLVTLGYSYTKRFTPLCHLVLGLGLSLAPVGAYLATTGHFGSLSILLGLTVLFWVSGFDIIYALQDIEFDESQGLKSIPVLMGKKGALRLSEGFHLVTALCLIAFGYVIGFSLWGTIGICFFILSLIYQHLIVSVDDLSRVNISFFMTNGVASIVFSIFVILDTLL